MFQNVSCGKSSKSEDFGAAIYTRIVRSMRSSGLRFKRLRTLTFMDNNLIFSQFYITLNNI